jgi:hypothetical protein
MAPRRSLGGLALAALVVCAWAACKDQEPRAAELGDRCQQLATACGDQDKHIAKLVEECTAATSQLERRCTAQVIALHDCYEKQLCGKDDKVWALDDLRVLAERHGQCGAEREALRACGNE